MDGRNSEVWKFGDACPAVISKAVAKEVLALLYLRLPGFSYSLLCCVDIFGADFVEILLNLSVKIWDKMENHLENHSKTVYDKNGQNISKGVKR